MHHRRFAAAVSRHVVDGSLGSQRNNVDDSAAFFLDHLPGHRPENNKSAAKIDPHYPIEFLDVRIKFNDRWQNISDPEISLPWLRRRVGMVFQSPNPLPMSIYKNMAFPLKIAGIKDKERVDERIEKALQQAFLWDEVCNRLDHDARNLSGGQQQRLCIARALILEPEILLLDEPTSSLDAEASKVIEELLSRLKETCTLLVVSHYQEQVQRIADRILMLENGRLKDVVTERVEN